MGLFRWPSFRCSQIMRTIRTQQTVAIPPGVNVSCKSRVIKVKGPRGILERSFKHMSIDIKTNPKQRKVIVTKHFGTNKEIAAVNTLCSHIDNMCTGVTKGFKKRMRSVYAHFPINVVIEDEGKVATIKNFLGEKFTRKVNMPEGVKISNSSVKDEFCVEGNNIEDVGRACSLIHQSTMVKDKDIRKFLDGIYVSHKGHIEEEQ